MDKKISFGFSKIIKKPTLLPKNNVKETESDKVELIKCLEGQQIKLVEEKPTETPLIIPLKENTKTSAAIASLLKRRAVLLGEEDEPATEEAEGTGNSRTEIPVNESLEQRAAREFLASLQGADKQSADHNLVVPAKSADELPLDGAKQSSIDDYEDVPIEQFGKAMLRGMGWVEPIQKKGQPPAEELPFVRPKGMGLGADKALKKQPLLIAPEKNEVLVIKKLAYVRLLGGKHKDMYGQIEGFDDHAGRVIVKMAIGGAKEAFNEFLCQPISKKEFDKYGKCINTAKYEEYKKMENEHGQIIIKNENIKKESSVKERREFKREADIRKSVKTERDSYDERQRRDENGSERQRTYYQSSSRRHQPDDSPSHSRNGKRDENARGRGSRDCEIEDERSSSRRRDERGTTSKDINCQEDDKRTQSASDRRQQYNDDTRGSSDTDSDSDSPYERKHNKKSSHKSSKAKKKSSKKAKHKHRHRQADTEDDDSASSDSEEDKRERRKHKKKTKKSKKARSRSRSHERSSNKR